MWDATWAAPLLAFLQPFHALSGDQRTTQTFDAIVQGLLTAGTTVCSQIANHAPALAACRSADRRVRRFARGETLTRSPDLDPAHLIATLRAHTLAVLQQHAPRELWVILDGSDLRKPYATALPHLTKVRALDGDLVPGYCTLNIIASIPGYRGILYQHVYSTREPDFRSASLEVQTALQTVAPALNSALPGVEITWLMDSGYDDIAVWRTLWSYGQRLVCRVEHTDRRVEYPTADGWGAGALAAALADGVRLARVETVLEVRLQGQKTAKRQPVTVALQAARVRVSYDPAARTEAPTKTRVHRDVWVVQVQVLESAWAPWVLLADGPVETAEQAQRVFQQYRHRWSIEDSLKFTKTCVDWEAVQVLDLRGVRMLVALAWVAAGFLYELGIGWDEEEVRLLARLGGWEERKDRRPGRQVLTRGLARLLDLLVTEAWLREYEQAHGQLPPRIAALIGRPSTPE